MKAKYRVLLSGTATKTDPLRFQGIDELVGSALLPGDCAETVLASRDNSAIDVATMTAVVVIDAPEYVHDILAVTLQVVE